MLQIKNLSKYSQKKYFFNIITKYKRRKSDFSLFLLYLVLTLINFYIYWRLKKTKNVWKLKKTKIRFYLSLNQKVTIHLTRMKKLEYPSIYPLIKLEGFVSICLYLLKKKLDSRTVFSQTKSLGSQMGKRWYEYENGKLGIILSKNI